MSAGSSASPRTLIEYLQVTAEFLAGKGVENARLDAELMLAAVLGVERLQLYTSFDRPLGGLEVDRFREMVRRRAAREPVSYITGEREFWSLAFTVDRRVLIPRPETELLVEHGARLVSGIEAARAADIGTGSGAVAVALAHEVPGLVVVATDISGAALEIAPGNAQRHGLDDRIEFLEGDLLDPLEGRGIFDLIVSNPPYILVDELAQIAPEVKNWEPSTALVSGDTGMDVTRPLVERAPEFLATDGWLLVEVGTQAGEVAALFASRNWRDVTTFEDLAGHPRVVGGRRPAP